MFHCLFNVFIFDMTSHYLLMFGITLRKRKFPANVQVPIANDVFLSFLRFRHFCRAKSNMHLVFVLFSAPPFQPDKIISHKNFIASSINNGISPLFQIFHFTMLILSKGYILNNTVPSISSSATSPTSE